MPWITTHYTTDGFIINITYDQNNVIEDIDIVHMLLLGKDRGRFSVLTEAEQGTGVEDTELSPCPRRSIFT